MIGYIKGKVLKKTIASLIVEAGGVGYSVQVPLSLSASAKEGEEIELYTATLLKDERLHLFGFSSPRQLNLFEKLISISGIGPKIAMNLISSLGENGLVEAVNAEDVKAISRTPGVGRKTAMRLIVELKQSLPSEGIDERERDVMEALLQLGFKKSEVENKVKNVLKDKELTVEEAIKKILREIGK